MNDLNTALGFSPGLLRGDPGLMVQPEPERHTPSAVPGGVPLAAFSTWVTDIGPTLNARHERLAVRFMLPAKRIERSKKWQARS